MAENVTIEGLDSEGNLVQMQMNPDGSPKAQTPASQDETLETNRVTSKGVLSPLADCSRKLLTGAATAYELHADETNLYGAWLKNTGAARIYVQLWNRAVAPAGGGAVSLDPDAGDFVFEVSAGEKLLIHKGMLGGGEQLYFSEGLVVTVSSTFLTYTAHGTAAELIGGLLTQ